MPFSAPFYLKMGNDENQNETDSQNVTNLKMQNESFTDEISSQRESNESNKESIYSEVDNLFSG